MISLDKHGKGDVVILPDGRTGVIVDLDRPYGEAAVVPNCAALHTWHPLVNLKVIGYRPRAMVWSGNRLVPAREIRRP